MRTADTIQQGDQFKKPGQNYWREAKSVTEFGDEETIPRYKRGKILVIVSARKKIIFSKTEKLIFNEPISHYSLSNN